VVSIPLRAINQAVTEFEFHMWPVLSSSRSHTGGLALALGGFLALGLALAGLFQMAAFIHFPAVVRRPAPIPREAAA
jgi:hypothetical protein